ncbi:hypothetical protein I6N96_12720 [Enterococcus sp. BWM-S5]|uniref:Uncharacterized protein n=1 Tax=Enterococcus larvae TaxID=2794352 RepID=A0ABS4CMF1_9ENTE|nr:hypothetical protein [Enterococcus larvae]MBP1047137.1 hypothetical protein [Enterococcus larvae]
MKRKTATKLVLFSAILGMGFLSETAEANILEAPGLIIPTSSDTVSSKYSFIAGFNEEKTETKIFGDGVWRELSDDGTLKSQGYSSKVAVFNPNQQADHESLKGKVGVLYTNVGIYDGKAIDLKVTLKDWSAPAEDHFYGNIMLGLDMISLNTQKYYNVDFDFEYFEHGTDTPADVSGFMTVNDLDDSQKFGMSQETSSNVSAVYVNANTNKISFKDRDGSFLFYDGTNTLVEPDNQDHTFTFTYSDSSKLSLSWGKLTASGEGSEDRKNQIIGDFFGYLAKKPVRTETLDPTKQGTDEDETLVEENTLSTATESWLYTITHQVPDEYEEFYYSSYAFKDTVLDVLDIAEESLIIMNELDEDVTNWFDITIQDNVIEYQAKPETLLKADFYNHYYRTMFSVRVKDGADVTPYLDEDGMLRLENQAFVSVNGEEKATNTTVTLFKDEIPVESSESTEPSESEPEISSTVESTLESKEAPVEIPDTSSGSNLEVIGISAMVSATVSLLFNIFGKKKVEDEK